VDVLPFRFVAANGPWPMHSWFCQALWRKGRQLKAVRVRRDVSLRPDAILQGKELALELGVVGLGL
jgi:hypothetical protein